jgi:hypothetical protein
MKQRAVAIVTDYLSQRPLGRVVGLKAIAEDDTWWRSKTFVRMGSRGPDSQRLGVLAHVVQDR